MERRALELHQQRQRNLEELAALDLDSDNGKAEAEAEPVEDGENAE